MTQIGFALLLALLCLPRCAFAQSTPASPTNAMREQADQLMQQCENTNELGQFDPTDCFAQHFNAGAAAMKRRNWNQAIIEETGAISILVTYRKRLRGMVDAQGLVSTNDLIAPYAVRSMAEAETKQYGLVISDASAMIAISPLNPEPWNDRCWNRAIIGDLQDALQDCDNALKLAPKSGDILDSTGFVYLKMKNYPAAVANYKAALKTQPKAVTSLYGLGLAEQAEGNQTQGSKDIAAAEQIDPKIVNDFGT